MKKILFVCVGNTCRSPMAAALFNKIAESNGLEVKSTSAGIMALPGQKAAQNAIWLMSQKGIDLSHHRARLLEAETLDEGDLILVMEKAHLDVIPESYKDHAYLLSQYASDAEEDIFDPVGGDLPVYELCVSSIEKHLQNLAKKLYVKN